MAVIVNMVYSKVAYLPVGAASLLFTGTKNKEKKSCFTTDGIVLAELLKSVGLDISFDANTSRVLQQLAKSVQGKLSIVRLFFTN